MLSGTIWITLSILGLMTAWHFWKNRASFLSSYRMYRKMLQNKDQLENLAKKPK